MTFDGWTTLFTVAVALVLLASDRFTPALAILGADIFGRLLVAGPRCVRGAASGVPRPLRP